MLQPGYRVEDGRLWVRAGAELPEVCVRCGAAGGLNRQAMPLGPGEQLRLSLCPAHDREVRHARRVARA